MVYQGRGNVALGALQTGYIRDIAEGINKPGNVEGTRQRGPYMPQNASEFITRLKDSRDKEEVFAVLKRNTRGVYEFAGLVGLHEKTWPEGRGTLGIMIFKEEHRGGTGSEAMGLLVQHSFEAAKLNKVHACVKGFNAPSLGHLLKCGFRIVGRYKDHHRHGDGYTDEIMLELFKHEWEPIWKYYQKHDVLPKLTSKQRKLIEKETS